MKFSFLFILSTALAVAQVRAPVSIAGRAVASSITFGQPPFAVNGTSTHIFGESGYYVINTTGDIAPNAAGEYTYTKTGPNSAEIISTNNFGFPDTYSILTFESDISGTSAGGFIGGPVQQTAEFALIPLPADAPLVNISTRATVMSGGSLQPGFVIAGGISRRVLIRAIGPSLASFGVTGVMENPRIEVYRSGEVIAFNDDWVPDDALTMATVGAFSLENGTKDAAIVLELAAGAYTAIVDDAEGGGGEVLLEVYYAN